jgi:hypothetical protein
MSQQDSALQKLLEFANNADGDTHKIFTVEEAKLIAEYIRDLRSLAGVVTPGLAFADIRKQANA